MKRLPQNFLQSLEEVTGFSRQAFEEVHARKEQITSIRLNPEKLTISNCQLPIEISILWSQYGFYLTQRPSFTFDPLFHAGCYYVQEASSMFLEEALKQLTDLSQPLKVLDLCAAPGGKSTHIQSLISPESLLVSNEVIKSRSNILTDNIKKWGCENVIVTNNDPAAFKKLPSYFDVIVADAPCSGSGLFRKDEGAIGEWSVNNVALCCRRQQRILADVLPALKEGGLLIYSTCSYSKEEDEDIGDWLVKEFGMKNEKLEIRNEWNIVESTSEGTGSYSYRFFPDKLKGEGFFLSCFRKTNEENEGRFKLSKLEKANNKEKPVLQSYLKKEMEIIKENGFFSAIPFFLLNDLALLNSILNIQYKGILLGQIMKDKLIPDHALALSNVISGAVPLNNLSYEEAILYLQKGELNIRPPQAGWQLVAFKNHALGWINALPNRINNYYPKEIRILKQRNDHPSEK